MADVVKREGGTQTMGQSPFALARGQTFERALFRDGGELLRESLKKAQVLPEAASGFHDFRLRQNGGPFGTLDDALAATAGFLKQISTTRPGSNLPSVIAGPVVRVPGGVMLPEAILVIDVVAATRSQDRPTLTVGEIKTYPDRGGYTDGAELATARAQAGVYVHGLRLVLEELGLDKLIDVPTTGFLVLSRPGFNRPSIRANEDLRYQVARAVRGFAQLRGVAAGLPGGTDVNAVMDEILRASVDYAEVCVSFCDRAAVCQKRALAEGDATVLGEDVARFLGGTNLYRAVELLDGANPENKAEEDLVRRMADARRH